MKTNKVVGALDQVCDQLYDDGADLIVLLRGLVRQVAYIHARTSAVEWADGQFEEECRLAERAVKRLLRQRMLEVNKEKR